MSNRHPIPVPCACGCGRMTRGQGNSPYLAGHSNKGRKHQPRSPGFPVGVLFDPEDCAKFGMHSWSLDSAGYVQRHHVIAPGQYTKIRLHREIMGFPDGEIDHINGNRLDNRRCNLRVTDSRGNSENVGMSSRNTSGFRGVSWQTSSQRWYAYGKTGGKMVSLGLYDDVNEAARVAHAWRQDNLPNYTGRDVRRTQVAA